MLPVMDCPVYPPVLERLGPWFFTNKSFLYIRTGCSVVALQWILINGSWRLSSNRIANVCMSSHKAFSIYSLASCLFVGLYVIDFCKRVFKSLSYFSLTKYYNLKFIPKLG